MNSYDDFKLKGREVFAEYEYFKGEAEDPYKPFGYLEESTWWNFEKRYHEGGKRTGKWKSFSEYFDEWIRERAAPETGHDLTTGNPWKERYLKFAPYADVIE
jgi:hypothetical protein